MHISVKSSSKVEASRPFSKLASKFRYNKRNIRKVPKGSNTTAIFQKVINDPEVTFGKPDKQGNQDILYKGKNVGWFNPSTDKGYIDNLRYDKLYNKANPSENWKDDDIIMAADDSEEDSDTEVVDEEIEEVEPDEGMTLGELKHALKNILDEDLCYEMVNYAASEDGEFQDEEFLDDWTFYDVNANADPKDFATAFYNGRNLTEDEDHADPQSSYFRYDGDTIDSIEDPGEYYYENLVDDIIDYILDNTDYDNYPEAVQELVDAYNESNSETDEE